MIVRSNEGLSEPIDITEGVFQGEILSQCLFSLYISDIISFFKVRDAESFFIGIVEVLMLLYADDLFS